MEFAIKIIIIIVLIIGVLYLNKPEPSIREKFQCYEGPSCNSPRAEQIPEALTGYYFGHGRRHPDQDIVWAAINERKYIPGSAPGLDPDTIAKLDDTILTDISRTSKTELAYNDIGVDRQGSIRPFNDAQSRISEAQADNGRLFADQFDNTFYRLWEADENRERDLVLQRAEEIKKSGLDCIDFKNVNQCMSVCSNTDDCSGFYIDKPNRCCMLVDPPYVTNRHSYNKVLNNVDAYGHRTLNALIRRAQETDKKVVFDYIRTDNGNDTYKVDMDRRQCKSLCPKCIIGRCPENYRCTNMSADPRYNYNCLITNEDRYDETTGNTFDSPQVPYLDDKYGLDEYAGYDNAAGPVLYFPPSYNIKLDSGIVPSPSDLQSAFAKYDSEHVGPWTYKQYIAPVIAPLIDDKSKYRPNNLACKNNKAPYESPCAAPKPWNPNPNLIISKDMDTKPKNIEGFCPLWSASNDPEIVAIRGGNDPTNMGGYCKIEGFDPWINQDCFDPVLASEDPELVAIRGGNDPINLDGYFHIVSHPDFKVPWVTKAMIEKPKNNTAKPVEKFGSTDNCKIAGLPTMNQKFIQYMNQPINACCSI